MSLEERVYSVLIVSSAENFNSAMAAMLPKINCQPIIYANSINTAKRTAADRDFDFVIINAPLKDDLGVRFAIDSSNKKSLVLILAPNEIHADVWAKVADFGVFTLAKPMSKSSMDNALRWLLAAKKRLGRAEKTSAKMENKMEEIRLVNKAKWLLISNEGLLEPEAHRYLEKEAMDRCVAKRVIAEEIIRKHE